MPSPFIVLVALLLALPATSRADEAATHYVLGLGLQRQASWVGSDTHRNQPIPYISLETARVSLSTVDGLEANLLGDGALRGGVYGNYLWGRSRKDLGLLAGRIASLSPRLVGGGFLEYALTDTLKLGGNISRDLDGDGAYMNLYADLELPAIGYAEQSIEVQWQAMNASAMRRFFGIDADEAVALDVSPWRPDQGPQLVSLQYGAFIPTSVHTGFALSLTVARLLGDAGNSPLVRRYGSAIQTSQSLAFLVHW